MQFATIARSWTVGVEANTGGGGGKLTGTVRRAHVAPPETKQIISIPIHSNVRILAFPLCERYWVSSMVGALVASASQYNNSVSSSRRGSASAREISQMAISIVD